MRKSTFQLTEAPPPVGKNSVSIKSTAVVSTEIVFTQHCNHHGTLFGGQVLDWMCSIATISASRLRKGFPVLKSIDDVHFIESGLQGERVMILYHSLSLSIYL